MRMCSREGVSDHLLMRFSLLCCEIGRHVPFGDLQDT